jgi:hypothetical protein
MCVRRSCLVLNAGRAEWNFNRDQADAVGSILGGVSVSVDSDAVPDTHSYRVHFSMSRQAAPNHQPRVSLEYAIQGLTINLAEVWGAQPRIQNVEQNPTQKASGADGCGVSR